jgi:hypothetical protein
MEDDLAYIVGREAARCLAESRRVYTGLPLDHVVVDWAETFRVHMVVHAARQLELRECIKAVVLFQAMMEALVNDAIEHDGVPEAKCFADKWKGAFRHLGIADDSHIEAYLPCYRELRNRVVHPKERRLQIDGQKLRFPFVHNSLREGWLAFAQLAAALGTPHDHNSWEIFCAANGVPAMVAQEDYPDLNALETALIRKHLDGVNSRLGKT